MNTDADSLRRDALRMVYDLIEVDEHNPHIAFAPKATEHFVQTYIVANMALDALASVADGEEPQYGLRVIADDPLSVECAIALLESIELSISAAEGIYRAKTNAEAVKYFIDTVKVLDDARSTASLLARVVADRKLMD